MYVHKVQNEALRNLVQFRNAPSDETFFGKAVAQEMLKIRERVRLDLINHEQQVSPFHHNICSGCGHHVHQKSLLKPKPTDRTLDRWMLLLAWKIYKGSTAQIAFQFYSTCQNALRAGRAPMGALRNGWVFEGTVPDELYCLSKYERQLTCLRLPCVYVWRTQGGFGQFACRGAPVSFSNPVSDLAVTLPRRASKVFHMLLENGLHINLYMLMCSPWSDCVRRAILWLKTNNGLYKDVEIDEDAFKDIVHLNEIQSVTKKPSPTDRSEYSDPRRTSEECPNIEIQKEDLLEEELSRGTLGPVDLVALEHLSNNMITGVEDADNHVHAQLLVQHMLRPFTRRKRYMLPSYDAALHLESYFPGLFPYSTGGPHSLKCHFATWVKHALSVHNSRFSKDVDFIFFVYSVLRRKRLTGLSSNAPVRKASSEAIVEVRELLSSTLPSRVIANRIDSLLRTGTLSASFETLRGSPAFWATMKRQSWAYLTTFGPCQLFVTISAADLIDPYVYCQINSSITFDEARNLSSKERADLLACNPAAASSIFHRRVQSFLDNFLFGEPLPFGEVIAFLGRIEQQARLSPHLHILIWLANKGPDLSRNGSTGITAQQISTFIELFCTALLPKDSLTSQENVPLPKQSFPPPRYLPFHSCRMSTSNALLRAPRHEILSRPCNANAFDGSVESNKELREQIIATQHHKCSSYCRANGQPCRFFFPFPLQPRASIASSLSNPDNHRCIALAPRSSPHINSTHPVLPAMTHANTDVTVITGSSIPESMYVCSYAVKADKTPLFNVQALQKLRKLDNGIDERKLLGAIARISTSVRVVGEQEAVDALLDRPLTFCSATVCNVNTQFLLMAKSALTEEQEAELGLHCRKQGNTQMDILKNLDRDDLVSIPGRTTTSLNRRRNVYEIKPDGVIDSYMRRPAHMEALSASQFYCQYRTRKLRKNTSTREEMLLLPSSHDLPEHTQHMKNNRQHYSPLLVVEGREVVPNRPTVRHILNVPSRGPANENLPHFAAACLCMHVPFRSVSQLLKGSSLTARLSDVLQSHTYPDLNTYVSRWHELSDALSASPPRHKWLPANQTEEGVTHNHSDDENHSEENYDDFTIVDDDIDVDPLVGLPPTITRQCSLNPLSIYKEWDPKRHNGEGFIFQLEKFKAYLKDCRTVGPAIANRNVSISLGHQDDELDMSSFNSEDLQINPPPSNFPLSTIDDPMETIRVKEKILLTTKTEEQRDWLDSVFAYLQTYYNPNPSSVPNELKTLCRENHPLLTNAPGGCGKSWLLDQVKSFVMTCIPSNSVPVWYRATQENEDDDSDLQCSEPSPINTDENFIFTPTGMPGTRFGRMAVFAPSGVAAGNANGFTFHNGLRSHQVFIQQVQDGPSPEVLPRLIEDFSTFSVVVIEEYSMAAVILIAYLDRVARASRPAFAHVFFGGIPVIINGDGLQLPVVNSYGLLSNPAVIPHYLQEIYYHCVHGVYWLNLSHSVRQERDKRYADLLLRMRLAQSTEQDVQMLNTRLVTDLKRLCSQSSDWCSAPILTARNRMVDALNSATIYTNGSSIGTFHVHAVPSVRRTRTLQSRRNIAKRFYNRKNVTSISRSSRMFQPAPITVLYPGMPIMLCSNLCPAVGLANGSIGHVVSIFQEQPSSLPPHELRSSVIERCTDGNTNVPSVLASFPNCYRGRISALQSNDSTRDKRNSHSVVLLEPRNFDGVKGLPIVPAHAISMHKSQSITIPHAIIDPRDTFCMGGLYVAFSRCPSLSK